MSALKDLIQCSQTADAVQWIKQHVTNHQNGEMWVFEVFKEQKSTSQVVDAVLEAFLNTRQNRKGGHRAWVHSLSHFTELLWEHRLDKWIKRFNEVAFKGATELDDSGCSERLVENFAEHSKWNDNPVDFHLTDENLSSWLDWEYHQYANARIVAGVFQSEKDFLDWKITILEALISVEDFVQLRFDYERALTKTRKALANL